MKNVSAKFVEKIKTHIVRSKTFISKILPFMGHCRKKGRAGHATDDNIIRRMSIACWINKGTDIHSEYVTCIAFILQ